MRLSLSSAQRAALVRLRQEQPGLRVVLIGAGAITAHLPFRPTADLDLVLVAALEDFPALLMRAGWMPHRNVPHRYRSKEGALFDVLPASDEVLRSGAVRFEDGVTMSALGFDLVLRNTRSVELDEGNGLELATLPVLLFLKMVAYLERPLERAKDLEDIVYLLECALDEDDERRWDSEHPVGANGLSFDEQSGFFLGLELKSVCQLSHRAHVARFLERVRDPDSVAFARMQRASRAPDHDGSYLSRLLNAFARGLR